MLFSNTKEEHDHQSLYEQFLAYMKGTEKKPLETQTQQQYKDLYSFLEKSNHSKRSLLITVGNREQNMKMSGCKFTRIKDHKQFNRTKESLVYHDSIPNSNIDLQQLEDKILMEEEQKKLLKQEIDHYKKEISEKKKEVISIKNQIKKIDLNQNKFLSAFHLSNNIFQFTDQFTLLNVKNYNKMVQQQENILHKLNKMKQRAKNQLRETKLNYHNAEKQHQIKFKKLIKTSISFQDQGAAGRKGNKMIKGHKKFMQSLQKVLLLLSEKEENFEFIKQQECTRINNKKFNMSILPPEEAEFMKFVDQFENKFEIRVQSSDKILVKLFRQIRQSNEKIEKRIFENKCLLEDYDSEYHILIDKKLQINESGSIEEIKQRDQNKSMSKKMEEVHVSSIMFIQVMEVVNSLLIKFRYIFKLFIMMNIDKRKLSDPLLKLDQILDSKSIYTGCRLTNDMSPHYSSANQDTNAADMEQIFQNNFSDLDSEIIKTFLFLIFNDIRASLIWRKTIVMEELQESKNTKQSWADFIKILESIREECEYSYNQKLKRSFKLLLDCFKSSIKGHQTLSNSSRYYLTHQKNLSFFNADLCLPQGMFAKVKIADQEVSEQEEPNFTLERNNFIINSISEEGDKSKPEIWGKQQKKNPSMMIRKLAAIRNVTTKKFKILNLHVAQKQYVRADIKLSAKEIGSDNSNIVVSGQSQQKENWQKEQISCKMIKQNEKTKKNHQFSRVDNFVCQY